MTTADQVWGAPIVSRHIADDVVDRLVTAIALGVYVPRQQLPTERELASMLGVSRTSVREALKQLTDTGYLGCAVGVTVATLCSPTGDRALRSMCDVTSFPIGRSLSTSSTHARSSSR